MKRKCKDGTKEGLSKKQKFTNGTSDTGQNSLFPHVDNSSGSTASTGPHMLQIDSDHLIEERAVNDGETVRTEVDPEPRLTITQLVQTLNLVREQHLVTMSILHKKIDELEQQNEELRGPGQNLSSNREHHSTTLDRKKIEDLEQRNRELCVGITQLQHNLTTLKQEHAIMLGDLHREIEDLRRQNNKLQNQLLIGNDPTKQRCPNVRKL